MWVALDIRLRKWKTMIRTNGLATVFPLKLCANTFMYNKLTSLDSPKKWRRNIVLYLGSTRHSFGVGSHGAISHNHTVFSSSSDVKRQNSIKINLNNHPWFCRQAFQIPVMFSNTWQHCDGTVLVPKESFILKKTTTSAPELQLLPILPNVGSVCSTRE